MEHEQKLIQAQNNGKNIEYPVSVTDEEQEHVASLLSMPSIKAQMPIVFANGNRCKHLIGQCGECGMVVGGDLMTGRIVMNQPNVAQITTMNCCDQCDSITEGNYRVYDDLRMLEMRNNTWGPINEFQNSIMIKIFRFFGLNI